MTLTYSMEAIAVVNSPFREKFAIPRQPGLVQEARGVIRMLGEYNREEYVRGLDTISHIWLVFVFHQHLNAKPRPLIRPPRLGGNKKIGVFASRSTYRPNPIGMSVVSLDRVTCEDGQWCLHISGLDLLDGTPILDIKPYLPYADIVLEAQAGYASAPPSQVDVTFTSEAQQQLRQLSENQATAQVSWESLVRSVLQQDPRPAYKQGSDENAEYGMTLYDQNIRWRVVQGAFEVFSIQQMEEDG